MDNADKFFIFAVFSLIGIAIYFAVTTEELDPLDRARREYQRGSYENAAYFASLYLNDSTGEYEPTPEGAMTAMLIKSHGMYHLEEMSLVADNLIRIEKLAETVKPSVEDEQLSASLAEKLAMYRKITGRLE
mgnify:CR=1 FL=1